MTPEERAEQFLRQMPMIAGCLRTGELTKAIRDAEAAATLAETERCALRAESLNLGFLANILRARSADNA